MEQKMDSLMILIALIVVSIAIGVAVKRVNAAEKPNFSICPLCNQVVK